MTQCDNLEEIGETSTPADQGCIDEETRQMHLAREFCRWGKYAKFSKDPEFKRRCAASQIAIANLMGHGVIR